MWFGFHLHFSLTSLYSSRGIGASLRDRRLLIPCQRRLPRMSLRPNRLLLNDQFLLSLIFSAIASSSIAPLKDFFKVRDISHGTIWTKWQLHHQDVRDEIHALILPRSADPQEEKRLDQHLPVLNSQGVHCK